MSRVVLAFLLSSLATASVASEKITFPFKCKGGKFSVIASVGENGAWLESEPIVIKIPGVKDQILNLAKDDPDRATYRNNDFEFYSFKNFTSLSKRKNNAYFLLYDACR